MSRRREPSSPEFMPRTFPSDRKGWGCGKEAGQGTPGHQSRRVAPISVSVTLFLFTAIFLSSAVQEAPLVLTQIPLAARTGGPSPKDLLESRYPAGSRVALVKPPYDPNRVVAVSGGLRSAGSPFVSWDGRRVLVVGQAQSGTWQVYEADLTGGAPRKLTDMPGGAFAPALISSGDLVFLSPVPCSPTEGRPGSLTAIYAQPAHHPAHRLTFGPSDVTDLTVLADGRILFVTALGTPASPSALPAGQALFSVNNDGTEFALYAGQHERPLLIQRPREVGKRIVYLGADPKAGPATLWPETVRTARPFSYPEGLFPVACRPCHSVDDGGEGSYLVSLELPYPAGGSSRVSYAVYRVGTNDSTLGPALFDDPAWDDLEAAFLLPRSRPMGHISVMSPSQKTGTLLCLDANYTSYRPPEGDAPTAVAVRISCRGDNGCTNWLGIVPVSADGSFIAEVPADVPLGFEALDGEGRVLRATAPIVWLRPGENRSCVGCHEPHGRSPRNHRPLAVRSSTPDLSGAPSRVGHKPPVR